MLIFYTYCIRDQPYWAHKSIVSQMKSSFEAGTIKLLNKHICHKQEAALPPECVV